MKLLCREVVLRCPKYSRDAFECWHSVFFKHPENIFKIFFELKHFALKLVNIKLTVDAKRGARILLVANCVSKGQDLKILRASQSSKVMSKFTNSIYHFTS